MVSSNYFGKQSERASTENVTPMSELSELSELSQSTSAAQKPALVSPSPDEQPTHSAVKRARKAATRRVFLQMCGAAASVGVAAPLDARFVEPYAVQMTRHTVFLPDLPTALDGITLAHLTDLHRGPITPDATIAQAVALTKAANPDMVMLTGDFVEANHRDAHALADLLAPLKDARLGLWGVLGNHDYVDSADAIVQTLQNGGVQMLRNSALPIAPGLWVSGIEDTLRGTPDTNAALAPIPSGEAVIFLTHNPVGVWGVASRPYLALAGHTHGGQIVIPGLPTPVAPGMDGFPLLAGWGTFDRTRLYISRGVGMGGFPLRFRCRPEVAFMELRRGVGRPVSAPALGEAAWQKKAMRTARRVLRAVS